MQSKATTVQQYLAELPADRRAHIQVVRQAILDNLDKDYVEGMSYGMIAFVVPHSLYPAGYHCDPRQALPFAGLASQKNYMSLYMSVCGAWLDDKMSDDVRWFREAWAKTGKKLDMGKSCIRFKKAEDLPLHVIGEAIRRQSVRKFIEFYETSLKAAVSRKTKAPPRSAKPKGKSAKSRRATKAVKTKRTAKKRR